MIPVESLETTLVVLQPTPYCNLSCRYCYLPDRDDRSTMSADIACAALRSVEASGLNKGRVGITWHAGEPLSLPVAYYRDVFARLRAEQNRELPVTFAMQTNAIAVTDAYCELLCDFDVHVGVSLDGPEAVHNVQRRTRNDKGSHSLTVRGFQRLQEWGLDPHVICVVTAETLKDPDGFFDFFAGLGVGMLCLNFEEAEGIHYLSSLHKEEQLKGLAHFLDVIYRRARQHPRMAVREFRDAYRKVSGGMRGQRQLTSPFSIVSVDWRGNFSTFSPELLGMKDERYGDFILGNVESTRIVDVLDTEKFQRLYGEILRGIDRCKETCSYFEFCGGGAPSNKLTENRSFDSCETTECRIRVKTLMDVVADHYSRELTNGEFWTAHDGRRG